MEIDGIERSEQAPELELVGDEMKAPKKVKAPRKKGKASKTLEWVLGSLFDEKDDELK
jgi:hypothetical protein